MSKLQQKRIALVLELTEKHNFNFNNEVQSELNTDKKLLLRDYIKTYGYKPKDNGSQISNETKFFLMLQRAVLKRQKEVKAIHVHTFEGCDSYNYYQFSRIQINGEYIQDTRINYGSASLDEAQNLLAKLYYIPQAEYSPLWRVCEENNIKFSDSKETLENYKALCQAHDKN